MAQMVSGDYKSATDNLHPALALEAIDAFCDTTGVELEERFLLHRALTGHVLTGEKEGNVDQCWGQLMGSPISFPILCIVNLAVTLHVMEQEFDCSIDLSEGECPVKVNGDDILFTLPLTSYDTWSDWVTVAGLAPSVGKNYTSREYCMINSKLFRLPWDWDIPSSYVQHPRLGPQLIPQLNLGLIRGGKSVLSGDLLSALRKKPVPWSAGQITDTMWEAVEGWDEKMASRIVSTAIRYVRPVLDSLPQVSWFVSRDKGGLGFPCFDTSRISEHHLRLAAWLDCLQDKSRREQYKLGFCRKGAPAFSSSAIEVEMQILERLRVVWSRCERASVQPDKVLSGIEGILMRSCSWEGPAGYEEFSYAEFRYNYVRAYFRWVKNAEQARSVLRPMRPCNAIVPDDRVWCCNHLAR